MTIKYIAEDGCVFNSLEKCQKYESENWKRIIEKVERLRLQKKQQKMTLDDIKVSIKENCEKIKNLVEKLNS